VAQILIDPETFYIQHCFCWQLRISLGFFPDGMNSIFDLYCEGRKWIFKLSVCFCGLSYLLLVKYYEELNVLVSVVVFGTHIKAVRLILCILDPVTAICITVPSVIVAPGNVSGPEHVWWRRCLFVVDLCKVMTKQVHWRSLWQQFRSPGGCPAF